MAFIKWSTEAFGVGVPRIDYQHRRLVSLLNELYDAMATGKVEAVLEGILSELEKYTRYHFSTEEEYMKEYDYPDYDFHRKEHKYFEDKVKEFLQKYKEDTKVLTYEVVNFLRDWIVHHILNIDKRLGEFLKGKVSGT